MIVAGFGFRTGAEVSSLQDALARMPAVPAATHIATLDDKARATVFTRFSSQVGLPICAVAQNIAEQVPTPTNSPASQTHKNTQSVAEATALAAAGPGARLLQTRMISHDRMATCALAAAAPFADAGDDT